MIRCVAGLALLACAGPAHARWLEATSTNFIVYSDGREAELVKFTEKLERFDQLLRWRTSTEAATSPTRVKVYLVASRAAIMNIYPRKIKNIAGFYSTSVFGPTAFVPRIEGSGIFDLDGEAILYHEYTHHFMHQYYPAAYPAWYSEGFAEYFSTVEFQDRSQKITVGKVPGQRVIPLYQEKWLPLEKLLTLTYQRQEKVKPEDMQQLYAQGWLLTHYLFSKGAGRDGQIKTYVQNINKAMPLKEAFEDAFKSDYETLGKELRTYFKKGKVYYTEIKGDLFKPGPVSVRPLGDPENALLILEAQLRLGVAKDDRAAFKARFAKAIAPIVQTEAGRLGQAELENSLGDPANVTALLEPLLKEKPAHPRALALQALAANKIAAKSPEASREVSHKSARSWAVKANRAAPETPLPLMLFYLSFPTGDKPPPDIAFEGLLKARELLPQDSYLTLLTASALGRANRKEEARNILRPMMSNPYGGSAALQAQSLMTAIDAGQMTSLPFDQDEDEETH